MDATRLLSTRALLLEVSVTCFIASTLPHPSAEEEGEEIDSRFDLDTPASDGEESEEGNGEEDADSDADVEAELERLEEIQRRRMRGQKILISWL